MAKAYEVSTFLENRPAHNAMNVPRVFRELFIRAGETSDVGIVPLRECLIEIFQNCSNLGIAGIVLIPSVRKRSVHAKSNSLNIKNRMESSSWLRNLLTLTRKDGWRVAPQVDFAKRRSQNKELLSMYIARMAGKGSSDEARRIWPFPEG